MKDKDFEVTKMSSRGQIVIPENIRNRMQLGNGSKFIVVGMNDTVILKRLEAPKFEKFDEIMKKSREFAKTKRIKPGDVGKAVEEYRKEKRR